MSALSAKTSVNESRSWLAPVFASAVGECVIQFADCIVGGANRAGLVSAEIVRSRLQLLARVAQGFDGSRQTRMPVSLGLSNHRPNAAA